MAAEATAVKRTNGGVADEHARTRSALSKMNQLFLLSFCIASISNYKILVLYEEKNKQKHALNAIPSSFRSSEFEFSLYSVVYFFFCRFRKNLAVKS